MGQWLPLYPSYIPAPSSGIYPGKKHLGKKKVQKFHFPPVSSNLGMGDLRC